LTEPTIIKDRKTESIDEIQTLQPVKEMELWFFSRYLRKIKHMEVEKPPMKQGQKHLYKDWASNL